MLMEVSEDMSDFQKDVVLTLDSLFEQAFKSRHDNFFIQILFGAKMMGMGDMDSIVETKNFVEHFYNMLSDKNYIVDNIRIGLMLYCHIFETNFIPRVIYNLITTRKGEYNCFPFPLTNGKWEMNPERKILKIKEKDQKIGDLMQKIYDTNIRNAFVHSDYILTNKEIILSADRNMRSILMPFGELENKLNNMLFFFDIFFETLMSYKTKIYNSGDVIYGNNNAERWKILVNPKDNQVIGFQGTFEEPHGKYLELR